MDQSDGPIKSHDPQQRILVERTQVLCSYLFEEKLPSKSDFFLLLFMLKISWHHYSRRFDALLTTYQQLAETCLFTLRLEGRCHTLYYLEMAIRDGNYHLEDETFEPDPYVITLNSDLMELDDCINASLPPNDEL